MDAETKKRKRKNGAETKTEMDSSVEIANQVEDQQNQTVGKTLPQNFI